MEQQLSELYITEKRDKNEVYDSKCKIDPVIHIGF